MRRGDELRKELGHKKRKHSKIKYKSRGRWVVKKAMGIWKGRGTNRGLWMMD